MCFVHRWVPNAWNSAYNDADAPKYLGNEWKNSFSPLLLSHQENLIDLLTSLVVQSLSCVWLFATPWTAAHQASLSFTISQSLLKLMSIESVMPSNCHPLLLLPSIFPSIRVFSSESALCIRWRNYWNFSFSISPSRVYMLVLGRKRPQCRFF